MSSGKEKKQKAKGGSSFILLLLVFFVVFTLLFTGVRFLSGGTLPFARSEGENEGPSQVLEEASAEEDPSEEPEESPEPEAPTCAAITIRCAGDIMAHESQLKAALDSETGEYDFTPVFSYIAPYLSKADLPIANIETTFHSEPPYTGYPGFKSPDALWDAIKTLGINVALLSNNHMLDSGISGLKRDIELIRGDGVLTAGAQLDGETGYTITEVNGVNIGIVAYTYETALYQGHRTVNGYEIQPEDEKYLNSFGYQDNFDADMQAIKTRMEDCRSAGADIIICYMHWGEEYQLAANSWQLKIGQFLAENGADIILASHPHVLQQIEGITVTKGGIEKTVPCFYSMGNFISNQRQETLNNRYTEEGMIACVNLTWSFENSCIEELEYGCIPTWVEKYNDAAGKTQYYIIPLTEGFEENPELTASGHVDRAKKALSDITELVGGEELIWQE